MARKKWKEWFTDSPPVLIIGAVAASLTFLADTGEKLWRFRKEVTAPEPPQAALRIERQGEPIIMAVPQELLKVPTVRRLLDAQQKFIKELANPPPSAPRNVIVRSLRLLLLNPKKEKLTVHSCKALIEFGNDPFPSRSIGYFVGTEFENVRAEQFDPLVVIEPEGALRVEATFLFPAYVPLGVTDLYKGEKWYPSLGKLEVQCEDQGGRILRASASAPLATPKPSPKSSK